MTGAAAAHLLLGAMFLATAGQAEAQPRSAPLMRAVRERPVLPRIESSKPKHGWARVMALAPGTEIIAEARGTPAAPHVFVHADESELVMLDLAPPLDGAVRRVLHEMASSHPEYFVQVFAGLRFVKDNVHVGPDGVFLAERRVVALSAVVKRTPRPDVLSIKTPPQRRGSLLGAAIGAGGGFVLGYASAVHLAFRQCGGSCGDEQALMALSLVGFPIGGAWLGYQANTHLTQELIYRP